MVCRNASCRGRAAVHGPCTTVHVAGTPQGQACGQVGAEGGTLFLPALLRQRPRLGLLQNHAGYSDFQYRALATRASGSEPRSTLFMNKFCWRSATNKCMAIHTAKQKTINSLIGKGLCRWQSLILIRYDPGLGYNDTTRIHVWVGPVTSRDTSLFVW